VTQLVDLSHPLEDGMAAYPGLPAARIDAMLDHDAARERYALGTTTPVRAYAEIPT